MTEIFNSAQQPFDQYWNLVFPGGALLLTAVMVVRRARRRWIWGGVGLTIFLFLLTIILPIADQRHVEAMAASPAAQTVEGFIRGHKRETRRIWTGTSKGVGVTSSNTYRTSTEEQFWIGKQWFWFEVGGMPSHASFTNTGDPPLPLKDGTRVRVTFFKDPWYQDQTRIVRMAVAAHGLPVKEDGSFQSFWRGFAAAAGRGDRSAVQARTRFPFLFAGTSLEGDQFSRIWEALFAPQPLRECLSVAEPVADGASWSVSCGVYVYVFERAKDGWRLASFTADPEAE